jgi:hypothetical protein
MSEPFEAQDKLKLRPPRQLGRGAGAGTIYRAPTQGLGEKADSPIRRRGKPD